MDGEAIKEGIDGLQKIEGLGDVLWNLMYWTAVIFVLLVIAYFCVSLSLYITSKRKGIPYKNKDDFLSD